MHVAGAGVLLRWAPWTSHLEGNCCAFQLARPGSPERATPQPARTEKRTLVSAKPLLPAPPDWERGKNNNTGWLVQVIIFIPEQLEDTSLNCCPESCPRLRGQSWGPAGAGRRSAAPCCTHTLHSVSLNTPALGGTLRAAHQKLEGGITPRRSLCQCPCTPRRCS